MNLKTKFKTVEDKVLFCLKEWPETRENDKLLMIKVWDLQGFRLTPSQQTHFLLLHSPESVRRQRQMIQARGFYKADSLKTAQRSLEGMKHRKYHRDQKEKV